MTVEISVEFVEEEVPHLSEPGLERRLVLQDQVVGALQQDKTRTGDPGGVYQGAGGGGGVRGGAVPAGLAWR